jgi:hypothetical protein
MRVLVCGDRKWVHNEIIRSGIQEHCGWFDTTIIEGGASGADAIAAHLAQSYSCQHLQIKAEWEKYGRAAGPLRNKRMLDEGKPDLVLAFHNDLKKSRGTKNMIVQALGNKIKVILTKSDNTSVILESLDDLHTKGLI